VANAWLDSKLLLRLLLPAQDPAEYAAAWELCSKVPQPWSLPHWQCLWIEQGLRQQTSSHDADAANSARNALKLWSNWLAEEIVLPLSQGGPDACELALHWGRTAAGAPLPAGRLLEPALAAALRCPQFASLDPRVRSLAKRVGLRLLPARL